MKIYFQLLKDNNAPLDHWPIFADVTCTCGKVMSLANYKCNNSKCIKCGERIDV